jgi:hypothetical protein
VQHLIAEYKAAVVYAAANPGAPSVFAGILRCAFYGVAATYAVKQGV